MTATNQPTLDMLPNMRNVAAVIAKDARDNLAGVLPSFPIVTARTFRPATSCSTWGWTLFMAIVYRTALIIALEEFFGRVQIFRNELTLAKYCAKEWPNKEIDRAVAELVRGRGLN